MSAEQQIDYSAVLADMEAKRTALDAAIASMRKFLNGQAGGSSTGESVPGSASFPSGEIPTGAFLGKSIPEAATLYLQIMKRKSTTREIAEGLRKGGMESTSSNFPGIVRAIIDRNRKAGGEIVKLDKFTWGLASWFPAGVRSSAVAQEKAAISKKQKRAKRQKKAGSAPKPKTVVEASNIAPRPEPEGKVEFVGTPHQQVLAFLKALPLASHSVDKISNALGFTKSVVAMNLGKLAKLDLAEKTPNGEYRHAAKDQTMPLAG